MRFYFLVAMTGLTSAIYLPQLDSLNLSSVPNMAKFKFGKGRRLQKHVTVSPINYIRGDPMILVFMDHRPVLFTNIRPFFIESTNYLTNRGRRPMKSLTSLNLPKLYYGC